MTTRQLLLVTTSADASARFFSDVDGWQTTTVLYDDALQIDAQTTYDVVYFRDPFNEGQYDMAQLDKAISHITHQQKGAYFVDNVRSLEGALIEDKWRQYELASELFPETHVLQSPREITEHTIAKKRISARARDIVFRPEQLTGDHDAYIVQPRLDIREEYRVYVVRGKVMHEGALKSSKSERGKVKVTARIELPEDAIAFARTVHRFVPQLDFYGLDIARTDEGLKLIEINRSPQFTRYNELGKANLAERVLEAIMTDREIYGSLQTVSLPEYDVEVQAKVDTGAWSGALHCTDMHVRDGKLHFALLGDPTNQQVVSDFETRTVRSATGHAVDRYLVPFTLEINGKTYHTNLGLSDRTLMKREMLLGRKFLIENNILVDVSLTVDDDYEAEMFL